MIGPAEIEDMRLDIAAAEQARLYAVAVATLDRHWAHRGIGSTIEADRIRGLVFERADERPLSDWKSVVAEATAEAGFHAQWDGDEVTLEART